MSKKKKIILFILVFIVILGLIGGTYAYLSWVTSEEQKTQVTFTTTAGFSCSADMGGAIKSGDARIIPTTVSETTRGNYIKRELVVNPVITVDDKTIYMDLWLDINSLGTGLSNSVNFKYALTTSNTSPTTGVVSSGNFNGKIAGSKVNLFISKEYSATTTETYYLWIWLDAKETNIETAGQSFTFSLNGSCTDKPLSYSEDILNGSYPELVDGMIPVVFDTTGTGTIVKTILNSDSNWYSYENKEWANIVLVSDSSRSTYQNTSGVVVNEDDILAYYVWIPRYKYKIWTTSNSSKGSEQEIEIIFEGKGTTKSMGTRVGEYITHPAFTFGGTEINGIWVGKFETGGTSSLPVIKPNVQSLRSQSVSDEFTTAQIFGTSTYGMDSKVDVHMITNSEWGAVAYLSHSKYGINREVYINNSSGFYTGRSGGNVSGSTAINLVYTSQTSTATSNTYGFYTWDGYLLEYNTNTKSSTRDLTKVASTTGNITGVYDMSGGAYEYTMGYYNLASSTWGSASGSNYAGFSSQPNIKYYDDYTTTSPLTACNGGICYGQGLSEVRNWYNDNFTFISVDKPWLLRGGSASSNNDHSGIFYFYYATGGSSSPFATRSILTIS